MSNEVEMGGIKATIKVDLDHYNKAMEKAKAKAAELGEAGKKSAASFSALNSQLSGLGMSANQIDKINEKLKRANPQILERQLAQVWVELTRLGASSEEIDKITKQLRKNATAANRAGKEMRGLGIAYTAMAATMAVVITKAIQASATFEQSMARVKAITGETGIAFEKLRNQAIQLGTTTVFTASQSADAMGYLAMAGFKTNQILEAMPSILSLAAAGQLDLARTADIASNILTGFQLNASETTRVVDVLAKGMASSNTNIEQLGTAMKYISPVAASVGISMEETAAAVGKLSDAGIQGEMAGTQMRAILLRLLEPSKEASSLMEKLGIQTKGTAGNVLSLANIMGQFEKAFQRLTQAQQAEVATNVAGMEAASGFLTLIKTGSSTLRTFTEELEHSGGTAQKMAETQMDVLNGSIDEMKSALEGAGISVGDKFAPMIRTAAEWVTKLFLGFKDMNPALQTAIVAFGTATVAVLGLAAAVSALTLAFKALNISFPMIGAISLAVGLLAAGVSALVTANNEAEESTRKFEQAQEDLNEELNKSTLTRSVAKVKAMQEESKKLTDLVKKRTDLERQLNEVREAKRDDLLGLKGTHQKFEELKQQLEEVDKLLNDLGVKGSKEAEQRIHNLDKAVGDSIPALVEMQRAELEDAAAKQEKITQMEQLAKRYRELARLQNVDEAQKQELIDVTDQLKKQYPELHRVMDAEGRIRIQNMGLVDNQMVQERNYVDHLVASNIQILAVWETQARAQKKSVEDQIANLEQLAKAMALIADSNPSPDKNKFQKMLPTLPFGNMEENLKKSTEHDLQQKKEEAYRHQKNINEMKRLQENVKGGDLSQFSRGRVTGSGVDLSKPKKERKAKQKKEKKGKSPAEIARELRKKNYDAHIASARYQADMFDWSAKKQMAIYEKIRVKHKQHLKEMVEDARTLSLQLKRLHEDTAKSKFDFSAEWIAHEERRMQDSYRSEVDMAKMKISSWTRTRTRYKKDSEMYKKADEQVYQGRKQLIQAQFNASSEWMTQEERRMEETGKTEAEIERMKLEAWLRIRAQYDKNSEYYKRADEQVYQTRKRLISEQEKQSEELVKKQRSNLDEARRAELKSIQERKKAFHDDYDARIRKIDALLKQEQAFNQDADHETTLAEKRARVELLQSAVGPEGIKERKEIIKDIERLELEHKRELRKRGLEEKKQSILDEKQAREEAFEKEKTDTEAKYESLMSALDDFKGNVQTVETSISEFRVNSNVETNSQILNDLDRFINDYNAKLATLKSVHAVEAELTEYNANKDEWNTAKKRKDRGEMSRLHRRNEELRRKHGIARDVGKLPSFGVGGVVPGPIGKPLQAIIHGGEAIFNPSQLSKLFALLNAPLNRMRHEFQAPAPSSVVNHIDMSVNDVKLEDSLDVETLFAERVRALRRMDIRGANG